MDYIYLALALLVSITVHEFMHAWTANYLGDPTARMMGRITLNPLKHLDLLGTLALFLVGFGWGKPVEVNPRNFENPKIGWALTSIAGPLANLVTAVFLSVIFRFIPSENFFSLIFTFIININIVLMIFNLLPIPPLDGSKVLYAILPDGVDVRKLEAYGPILLLLLIFLGKGILFETLVPAINGILNFLKVPSFY